MGTGAAQQPGREAEAWSGKEKEDVARAQAPKRQHSWPAALPRGQLGTTVASTSLLVTGAFRLAGVPRDMVALRRVCRAAVESSENPAPAAPELSGTVPTGLSPHLEAALLHLLSLVHIPPSRPRLPPWVNNFPLFS